MDRIKMQAFDYKGITLTGGPVMEQRKREMDYILSLPIDDLLRSFRIRAGMYTKENAPGKDMGGWYDGHTFGSATLGQYISALAKYYAQTGENIVLIKLKEFLKEFTATISQDGYFYCFKEDVSHARHYIYDKILQALTDLYLYADIQEAQDVMKKITLWAVKNLDRNKCLPIAKNFVGVYSGASADNEWYTLSENLYRAYLATGDELYREFAKVWEYGPFWDALRLRFSGYWTGLHAYSHVNSVGGAALKYLTEGDRNSYETIENFFNVFEQEEFFAGGGYGPGECLVGNSLNLANMMKTYKWTYEIPCCTWAGFKLGRHLLSITGQSRMGDWIEKQLFNYSLAILDQDDDKGIRGRTFYYGCFAQNGATKFYFHEGWPCCSGTYALCVAEYVNLIYFKTEDSLYVNLFLPSEVKNIYEGKQVTVTQETNFPNIMSAKYKISIPDIKEGEKVKFKFFVRVPQWAEGEFTVTVNGNRSGNCLNEASWGVRNLPDNWAGIGGEWTDGDEIEVSFKAGVYFVPCDKTNPNFGNFMYGPVVLVERGGCGGNIFTGGCDLNKIFVRESESNLHFSVVDGLERKFEFVPYYDIKEGETLSVYLQQNAYKI